MISAIIIDDNKRHREDVVTLLVDFPDINVVAQCANGFEGLEAIAFLKPQLVFLDVDMPNLNGFEMLEKIANIDFDIIFTTAFGEYAIQAFEIACLDYLTKPLNRDRFKIAMDRFNLSKGTREKLMHYQILIENQKKINSSSKKIALRDGSGTIHLFPINSIVYCSSAKVEDSNGAYTVFHFTDLKSYTATKNLGFFENLLESFGFSRPHDGYLVNLNYVNTLATIKNPEITIEFYSEKIIPVSRGRKNKFESVFINTRGKKGLP